jgi:hypothetical protein
VQSLIHHIFGSTTPIWFFWSELGDAVTKSLIPWSGLGRSKPHGFWCFICFFSFVWWMNQLIYVEGPRVSLTQSIDNSNKLTTIEIVICLRGVFVVQYRACRAGVPLYVLPLALR